ncbi:DNA alkylation repair protein [Flavobacterium cerinum]|uniref:DNA alkylation repair protein n=1 Tax=Flavobacterium cerinum TaxID=2502784 RepID=A0A3S4SW78_9FLAO|nr:DNA alkylation repair protein [Flavobacterium cerinum]RWW93764.1 DNA alkylation repair protein [Flavobacterium cerinum]
MSESRKGARSIKEIPPYVLEQLNKGETATVNLTEWLAVDQKLLFKNILNKYNRTAYLKPVLKALENLKNQTVNTINEAIGNELLTLTSIHNDTDFFNLLKSDKADMARCWAAYSIGKDPEIPLNEKLKMIQHFAADKHFGVREISWMAVRKDIIDNITESISVLSTWTSSEDENIRRFASEATRPRGVWCEHIEILKQNPEIALSILSPLSSDPSKYVQNSVANWLNDAGKTNPSFVVQLCSEWEKQNTTKQTVYIIKRALRTINEK